MASATRVGVVTGLPLVKAVEGHFDEVPFFLTSDMFGGLPVEIAGGEISSLVDKPVASTHSHRVDEIYLLLSPSPGGAVIDVTAGGETVEVVSPAAVHIPAGTEHQFVTRRAERGSYCLGILLSGR